MRWVEPCLSRMPTKLADGFGSKELPASALADVHPRRWVLRSPFGDSADLCNFELATFRLADELNSIKPDSPLTSADLDNIIDIDLPESGTKHGYGRRREMVRSITSGGALRRASSVR